MIERLLSQALSTRFEENDLLDCFLVVINVGKYDRVQVFIDSDSHLTLERCRKVSRYLEKQIEEKGWLGEKYTLEVSSPGLDRPLKLKRQYYKNIGRKIEITTNDGSSIKGILTAVDDNKIGIVDDLTKNIEVEFKNIDQAKILASFK